MKTKAAQLSKEFGGVWKYDGQSDWWCDDEKRHVGRRCCGAKDFEGEALCDGGNCSSRGQYWLYGDGITKPVYFTGKGVSTSMCG